jgi:glycosyltransferase involved in cell wall biosynthesis
MRVGLNLSFLVEDSGGAGTYARELALGLQRVDPAVEITAWVGRDAPRYGWLDALDVIRLPVRGVGGVAHFAWDLGLMVAQARRRRLDVLHGLAYVVAPVHPRLATVVTLLDTIWKRVPETMAWQGRVVFGTMAPLGGRTSDRVIAISEAGRADLISDLRIPAGKIDVVPLGITAPDGRPADDAVSDARRRLGIGPEPVVLCVAQKRAHKNLEAAIEAVGRLDVPAQLVLPGGPNAYEGRLRALAERVGAAERVRFVGWVGEEDLEALYAMASVFVLPSLLEGFGLPILEAMAREVPVACSDVSALPEVAGDAALLFDPHDHDQVRDALRRLLVDDALRAEMARRGQERARQFSWDNTARGTLAVYERALAGR